MALPHRISTLLYAFDHQGRVLLMERSREPNQGLWSPPGGKLETTEGESPYACACREAREELGLSLEAKDLHLTGMVSERGYGGAAHWLMFLFEVLPPLDMLPPPIDEGRFAWFHRREIAELPIPQTDRESIWPLFWAHRGGFFAAHCVGGAGGSDRWVLEESGPAGGREVGGQGLPERLPHAMDVANLPTGDARFSH